MNKMKVKRGDSTDIFELVLNGITDYTDYRAEAIILNPETNSIALPKQVFNADTTNKKFSIFFLPAQTAALDVGDYNVVCEIIKEVSDGQGGTVIVFRRELSWALQVQTSLINN